MGLFSKNAEKIHEVAREAGLRGHVCLAVGGLACEIVADLIRTMPAEMVVPMMRKVHQRLGELEAL